MSEAAPAEAGDDCCPAPPLHVDIGLDDARRLVLQQAAPLRAVEVPLAEGLDHVAARRVRARLPLPPFTNSAMDGYAIRAEDLRPGARLSVVEDVTAGHRALRVVGPGQATRIMTGAALPEGADTVVPFELTRTPASGASRAAELEDAAPPWVVLDDVVRPGAHVRQAGEDIPLGTELIREGSHVGPGEIALLAAVGCRSLSVHRRPVVAVISTGDELAGPGGRGPTQVHDANGPALAALVVRAGAELHSVTGVRDDPAALLRELSRLSGTVDLVLASGGASGGAADIVARLARSHHDVQGLSVRMRPGRPLVVGTLGGSSGPGGRPVVFLGLPGNPVAAMVAFELFARPAIARMRGLDEAAALAVVTAVAGAELAGAPDRVSLVRVTTARDDEGRVVATPTPGARSHGLRSAMGATALAEVPPGQDVRRGDPVRVHHTGWSAE